jgi:hypothetical protein
MCEKLYEYDRCVTIFHYDKWHKFFIAKEDNYYQPKGIGLPANSTDIELPNQELPKGQIYVFENGEWIVKEDTFPRVKLIEENYIYSKECLTKQFQIESYSFLEMPRYEAIERFTNPELQSLMIVNKYLLIQHEFMDILKFHERNIKNLPNLNQFLPEKNPVIIYRLKTEGLILSIRKLFDELVQLTYVTCYKSNFDTNNKIEVDCIGGLFTTRKDSIYPLCKQILIGDGIDYDKDNTEFLKTINKLFNSIKHSVLYYEAMLLYSDIPNVVSFYKDRNKFSSNDVLFFNHSLFQIMFGFQSNFKRIIKNQKKYLLSIK